MTTTTWSQKAGMHSATDVDNLENYAEQAEASKDAAAASAAQASTDAALVASKVGQATTKAAEAAASANAAQTAETNAETAETNAAASAVTSASQAATSTTKASEASASATNAATSETNAATSATAAAASETAAATSATNAATSETNAATSEANAAANATTAITAANSYNVTTVVSNIASINDVAAINSDINVVVNNIDDITNVSSISSDISDVADTTASNNISTVAGNIANVNLTGGSIASVNLAASNLSAINTVNANSSNINATAAAVDNINTVASDTTDINTVASISTDVTAVSGVSGNIPIVAGSISSINTVASEIDSLIDIQGSVDAASASAATAAADATDANSAATQALGYRDTASLHKLAAEAAATSATSTAAALTGFDLEAIAATKADTAVDVFVYDTSKDSDGGAWRKRTQGTSWYNETLNTATRGSRREFPAVAVIVAESNKVTIYDGDDPSLPMWGVWLQGVSPNFRYDFWRSGQGTATAVTAVNGQIGFSVSVASYGGFLFIDLINDVVGRRTGTVNRGGYGLNASTGSKTDSMPNTFTDLLLSELVNDVAMTVLPNAPIDPATGLPVPTIAVATGGGVSVIKDDGAVFNPVIGGSYDQADLAFNEDWSIMSVGRVADRAFKVGLKNDEFAFETKGGNNTQYVGELNIAGGSWTTLLGDSGSNKSEVPNFIHGGSLSRLKLDRNNASSSLINYTTSTYNTGWMNGDIKGAFLSDTDDTDLVDAELVIDGTFDSGANWSLFNATVSGGVLSLDGTGGVTSYALDDGLGIVSGKFYEYSFDVVSVSTAGNGARLRIGSAGYTPPVYSVGTYSGVLVASGIDRLQIDGRPGFIGTIDNVSVKLADADRSVNANGLIVNGTVTRSPVATGADLVAYSGFSSSNHLEQPYNSDLDFGTGDFCVMGWGRTNINGTFLSRGDGVSAGSWYWRHYNNSTAPFYIHDGSAPRVALNVALPKGDFVHFALLRRSGVTYLYGNGALLGSLSGTYPALSMSNATAKLRIGELQHSSYVTPAEKLALLRISATAPSPEQIAKIYNDEKVLFQENAQATLYGSSDAVTALAYDDTTELLHVGTSGGRSVFQGLRRVENTTDAVGTAISASNGLVVEE